ncbi:hypothetical protein DAI22_08g100201 [Oryza sativa Japonica Group]|nr:hypothetical protein DAI22_08g100201 [Oryza sativa Japonica Group]
MDAKRRRGGASTSTATATSSHPTKATITGTSEAIQAAESMITQRMEIVKLEEKKSDAKLREDGDCLF